MQTLTGHQKGVRALAISDRYLATAGFDQTVLVWNWSSGRKVASFRAHNEVVRGVAALYLPHDFRVLMLIMKKIILHHRFWVCIWLRIQSTLCASTRPFGCLMSHLEVSYTKSSCLRSLKDRLCSGRVYARQCFSQPPTKPFTSGSWSIWRVLCANKFIIARLVRSLLDVPATAAVLAAVAACMKTLFTAVSRSSRHQCLQKLRLHDLQHLRR